MFYLLLIIPVLGQAYTCWRFWHLLPLPVWLKICVMLILCAAFTCLFVLYGLGPERLSMKAATFTYEVGNSWLIILLYCVMLFLLLDLLRLVRLLPASFLESSTTGSILILGFLTLIFSYGHWKYNHKERVSVELKTAKDITRNYRIVLLSDLHLGYHNRRAELARWVSMINKEKPDAILIAGDIIDVSVKPLIADSMAAEFRKLQAPVYACLGNHEYYSGDSLASTFYRDAGIRLLRDESAVIGDDICIIGRDDRTNVHRKSLATLAKATSPRHFSILLDHQPYHLERTQNAGIDFQFSGHTHHGQVWPISLITELIYEDAFGPLRRGKTFFYVSSGMGIWGGKFRIGTQSEYIVAEISRKTIK